MAKAKAKPAPKPAARAAAKPAPRAAARPAAATRPAARAAAKPQARAASRPAARATGRPAAKARAAPQAKARGGASKPSGKPAKGKPKAKAKGKQPKGKKQAQAASAAPSASDTGESTYQQEIDILRGQVGTLNIVGLWTSANPPKVAGVWGRLLQGLMAGVSLRDAFASINHAAAVTRDNNAKILALVKNHKTPTFKTKKGK